MHGAHRECCYIYKYKYTTVWYLRDHMFGTVIIRHTRTHTQIHTDTHTHSDPSKANTFSKWRPNIGVCCVFGFQCVLYLCLGERVSWIYNNRSTDRHRGHTYKLRTLRLWKVSYVLSFARCKSKPPASQFLLFICDFVFYESKNISLCKNQKSFRFRRPIEFSAHFSTVAQFCNSTKVPFVSHVFK